MFRAVTHLAVAAFLLPAQALSAQEPPFVQPGARVKMLACVVELSPVYGDSTSVCRRNEGTVERSTRDSVELILDDRSTRLVLPLASVQELEVRRRLGRSGKGAAIGATIGGVLLGASRGPVAGVVGAGLGALLGSSPSARKGAVIGFLVGALSGSVLGAASGDDPPGWFSFTAEEKVVMEAIGFGLVGGAIWSIVGAVLPAHHWEEIPLDRVRVSFAPQRDGRFALGLTYRF